MEASTLGGAPPAHHPAHHTVHNPAHMLEDGLGGVPEAWARSMQLARPARGVDICCIRGQPGMPWGFESTGAPNLSLSILLDGQIEAAVEGGTAFRLTAGQALLMACGQALGGWGVFGGAGGFHLVNIHLDPQALPGLAGLGVADVLGCMREACCALAHVDVCMATRPLSAALRRSACEISHCSDCAHLPGPARNAFLCARVSASLAALLAACTPGQHAPGPMPPCDRPKIRQARALLEGRCAAPWSVPALARAVGLPDKRLQGGFQSLYGSSVHQCLVRIRLDAACALLACGHTVSETAQRTGFANISHFSKVFRQHMGVSPGRWGHGG